VREKNYTLSHLAESQLQESRADIQPEQVPDFYENARKLDEFVRHSQHDAYRSNTHTHTHTHTHT
jgi:hypothetical protein